MPIQEDPGDKKTRNVNKNEGSKRPYPEIRLSDLPGMTLAVVLVFVIVTIYVAHYYVNEHSASIKFATEAIFSFLALLVIIAQALIYAQQAQFMRSQLNISRETFELLERPSLGVIHVAPILVKDTENRIVRFTIHNTGHLPARLVTVTSGVQIARSGTAQTCGDVWQILPLPTPTIISKGMIPVNAIHTSHVLPAITKEQFGRLDEAQNVWLYAYCRIEYGRDGKTQPYFTEYYGRFNRYTGEFDVCDKHNDGN